MKVEVSNGELFDKLSILLIKKTKIKDEGKLDEVYKEIAALESAVLEIKTNKFIVSQLDQLLKTNKKLWAIEDKIRRFEKLKRFDKCFVELARSVYKQNDKRALIKHNINICTNSNLVEVKSYAGH